MATEMEMLCVVPEEAERVLAKQYKVSDEIRAAVGASLYAMEMAVQAGYDAGIAMQFAGEAFRAVMNAETTKAATLMMLSAGKSVN